MCFVRLFYNKNMDQTNGLTHCGKRLQRYDIIAKLDIKKARLLPCFLI